MRCYRGDCVLHVMMKFMKDIIALVMFILLCVNAEGHIKTRIRLLDSQSRQPIECASVFNAKGELLATSDALGYISFEEDAHQLSISHVAYINKDVDIDTLKGNFLYLNSREYVLNEVSVTAKRPEYVVLEAYFRAPQFYNGQLEYYYDGVAYYFVKLKNGDVYHRVIVSRFLTDDSIKNEEYSKGKMFTYVPPMPILDFKAIDRNKETMCGVLQIDTLPSKVRYGFDNLYPDTVKSFMLGKYNQLLRNSYSSEVYSKNPDGMSYTDFISGRSSRQMVVRYKNTCKVYDQWEEVYITKVSFADKHELNNLKKDKTNKLDVEQYIEQHAIPPISNVIKAKLSEMKVAAR